MSAYSRDELLCSIRPQYKQASCAEKTAMLNSFVAATGLSRKHAITLLAAADAQAGLRKRIRSRKYDDDVVAALQVVWQAANRICSKRLIPFLPSLVESLEKFGHMSLGDDVRFKLLSMSAATADRILKKEKAKYGRSCSLTKPGHLIKKQIEVRTFAGWSDAKPGFLEADLVAHCGDSVHGQFLNTLTMTDIATGWTELAALLRRGEADVLNALEETKAVLPFPMLGFDTDNGSEFINYEVVGWCARHKITFTRSREYRKNDQAHVEEKNGSIVRRLIGYDRFEGERSCRLMAELYKVARLYINFFQPCLKLESKYRDGARIRKQYKEAATPFQRILDNGSVAAETKQQLRTVFDKLDPVALLQEMKCLQERLWGSAHKYQAMSTNPDKETVPPPKTIIVSDIASITHPKDTGNRKVAACSPRKESKVASAGSKSAKVHGRPMDPTAKKVKPGRSTEIDAVQDEIAAELGRNPSMGSYQLIQILMKRYPGRFRETQKSTLHKHVLSWRMAQLNVSTQKQSEPKLYRAEPCWAEILKRMIDEGVTRRRLWKEYQRTNKVNTSETYGYSQFCKRLSIWLERSCNQVVEPDWRAAHAQIRNGASRISLWETYAMECEKAGRTCHTYNNYCRRYLLWLRRGTPNE